MATVVLEAVEQLIDRIVLIQAIGHSEADYNGKHIVAGFEASVEGQ